MVQQLRNLKIHAQPQSMYNGQDNGYRNSIATDCLTPPHNSEQSFSYPWMGRTNGYSAMNGNGHVNGHMDTVGRPGPTRTSPLTVEEEAALNGLNGVNGMNGLNGMNGVNGIMNGHSDYNQRRVEEIRRRKSELMNYTFGQRFRCAQYVPAPNGYSQFQSNPYYPNDVGRFGPVGTRVVPDIDRFNGYSHYPPSSLSPRALIDGHMDVIHNASFHPHGSYIRRTPYVPDSEDSDSGFKTDSDTKSLSIEDSTAADDAAYSRPHLSSVSSGVSSGDSYGSHSPRSHSPLGSPRQHSPDVWAGSADVWSSGDVPTAPFLPQRSEESDILRREVWTPTNSDELSGWFQGTVKEKANEGEKESSLWARNTTKKRTNHQALLDSFSSCNGYWSDPEITRYQQIKDDEIIARTLQSDEAPPEITPSEVKPSAPPASEMYEDQANDATIALELQNMENDEHGVRVEKERLEFEERKEKEVLKRKQIEEDREMAVRVENEQEGVRYVTDEETIKIHKRLYKEHQERVKELNSKDQETKDRCLAESLVYEDAYSHGLQMLPRPDPEVIKPIKYPVKIVPRGARRLSPCPSPPVAVDVLESSVP